MNLNSQIDRMIAAGMSPGDAGSVAAEIYAAGVAAASVRSSGAERQRRYRENHGVTNRHEPSQSDVNGEASQSVTDRHKALQSDASIYISSNNKEERKNIDIPERHALHPNFTPSQAAKKVALQKGFEIGEVLEIYRNHLKASGQTSRDYDASFCNFMLNRRSFAEKGDPPAPVIGDKPTLADYERAAANFAKDNSKWGNRIGPEPGMGGCRCPPEILVKYGIDPKTGLPLRKSA